MADYSSSGYSSDSEPQTISCEKPCAGCLVLLANWVPGDGSPLWCKLPIGKSPATERCIRCVSLNKTCSSVNVSKAVTKLIAALSASNIDYAIVKKVQTVVRAELGNGIADEAKSYYHGQNDKKEDDSFKALGAVEHALKDIIKKDYPTRGGKATAGLDYDLQILQTLVEAAREVPSRQSVKEAIDSFGFL